MRRFIPFLLASLPALALADNFPYVTKGPVISGVSATDAWVTWETAHHEGSGTECTIEADTPFVGNHNDDTPTLTLGDGTQLTDSTCSRDHKVHLTGLTPDSHLTFTLDKPFDSQGGPTAGGEFTTATTDQNARFSFVVYGDNRDDQALTGTSTEADHQAIANAIATSETDAAFLVNTGDLALNITAVSGDDKGYSEFFDVERGILSVMPLYAAIGNHETLDTSEFDLLVNPHSWDGSAHKYYWSFDWGAAHFAFVDAFEGGPALGGLGGQNPGVTDEQAAWLDQDLSAAQARGQILFVVAHQSPFSHPAPNETSGHGDSQPMQDKVLPLMLRYGVSAIFAGHDHYYQHGKEGCIDYYVVGGGGAPQYEPDPNAEGVLVAKKAISYAVVTVDGHEASGVAKTASGSILDTFDLTPADGAPCGVETIGGGTTGGEDGGTGTGGGITDQPDAGTPGGGGSGVDAGTPGSGGGNPGGTVDGGTGGAGNDQGGGATGDVDGGSGETASAGGCQCGPGASGSMLLGLVFFALALARRRRRT